VRTRWQRVPNFLRWRFHSDMIVASQIAAHIVKQASKSLKKCPMKFWFADGMNNFLGILTLCLALCFL